MTYTNVTEDNVSNYELGTHVEFNYGPMHGSEYGRVTGWRKDEWGTQVVAVTDDGEKKFISGFTDVGVGVYILD